VSWCAVIVGMVEMIRDVSVLRMPLLDYQVAKMPFIVEFRFHLGSLVERANGESRRSKGAMRKGPYHTKYTIMMIMTQRKNSQ
jgi:hypothetical protein